MDEHHLFHIVAASGTAQVIGNNNKLPWPKIPEDLKFFKETTGGHTVIMGRKTFESIGSKPLPNRENIVLTHSDLKAPKDVKVFHSFEDAIQNASNKTIFIIGGAELYKQTMDKVEGIYLTKIEEKYAGDTKYPPIPSYFKKNEDKTKELQEKYETLQIIYLENTFMFRQSNKIAEHLDSNTI